MKRHNNIEQRSDEWHQIRKGKVTGTTLKAIMSSRASTREDALYEIVAERLTIGVDNGEENAMDRGTRLEPDAISTFEFNTGLKVERTGFAENDDNSFIGYSPDGLIMGREDEDIEVKCPGGKNYVKMWLTNEVPEDYHWQMVQAFIVNPKLQKRYFVGYNPDIPVHPMHIIEVTREAIRPSIANATEAQTEFLGKVDEILKKLIKL